jgi:hypothetical protein
MISQKHFAATVVIVLAIASGMIALQPTATATQQAPDGQKAAGAWFVDQIEKDTPERVRRALNTCVNLHLGRDGKVDWLKAKRCYANL